MSHGRRMLEAQAKRERMSGNCEDGRLDDGHLRNGSRALNDDGTPVRLSRSSAHTSSEDHVRDGGHDDAALVSPPPRPNVRLGLGRAGDRSRSASSVGTASGSALGSGSAETSSRQQRISGIGPPPVALFSCAPLTVPRPPQLSDKAGGGHVSAPRQIDVEAEKGQSDDNARKTRSTLAEAAVRDSPKLKGRGARDDLPSVGDSAQGRTSSETRGRSRTGGSGRSSASGLRYPVSRVNAVASTATLAATLHDPPSPLNRSRTGSRSPPPMTAVQKTATSTSVLHQSRAIPIRAPITAAVFRPRNTESGASPTPDTGTAVVGTRGASGPTSLQHESSSQSAGSPGFTTAMTSSGKTSPLQMLMPPASPPLRAGVSPRMLPLHPTRVDASGASVLLSRATSVSTVTTTVTTTPSSQVKLPPPVGSQVSPYELQQQQPYTMPLTPSSTNAAVTPFHSVSYNDMGDRAGNAVEEDHAATETDPSALLRSTTSLSQKSEPAVATAGHVWQSAPSSPLPASAEVLARPRLPLLPEATVPYEEVGIAPLANSLDRRVCPFMRDFSGFHNSGNDCYGCSLLTMLLRSEVFRHALLSSPLVCAMRRYEALLTGKAERRVLWTSGYVSTAAETKSKKTAVRKRARAAGWPANDDDDGGQTEEASVAGVGGLPDTTERALAEKLARSRYIWRPTAPVQHTLDILDTFSLHELDDALEVDLETQRVPATLHGALAALARAQRWREHMTTLINTSRVPAVERQRLLETKIYHDNDRDFDGQVYTYGIRLNAVANLLDGEFFLGDQEDAHELFVSVMAKLESEAVKFQHRCDEVLERRSSVSPTEGSSAEDEEGEEVGLDDRGLDNERRPSFAEKRLLHGTHAPTTSSCGPSAVPDAATTPAQRRLCVSTAAEEVWINRLVRTRLLNIIRCRTGDCHHEIVTDEVCVNLSVHIPEESQISPPPASSLPPRSCFPAQPPPLSPTPIFPSSAIAAAVAAPLLAVDGGGDRCCSLTNLLHKSMAYEPLNEYRCDRCGSRTSQFQGGCFYTRPPPLLVLQLKRFATQFVNGTIIIQKNGRHVAVEDTLVIHALLSAEECRAEQRRLERQHRCSLDSVVPREMADAETDACESAMCCSYYDADKKCFSTALQEACDMGRDGGLAGRDELKDRPQQCTGDDPLTSPVGAAPPSSLVWAVRCLYRLRSCVLHLGQSLHYGHYVSDFAVDGEEMDEEDGKDGETLCGHRTAEEEAGAKAESPATLDSFSSVRRRWRRANDERVEGLSDEAVQARRAGCSDTYLLLYEKVTEERVLCPVEEVLPKPVYRDAEGSKA
ncbi:ubiquitin hydrolase, putative [Leishmania tarentolae]|uniref:ubiquitinyl hydrolase 1 n=1 Tax=Leishmania tarentolae TaxID=5689 RepID=A0A640KEF0_LEITA|nr:ubiquitin hydrolase, putative [Leishmania tarentolae]